MKLSDVVSSMNVSIFATLPLLIFVGIFIGVMVHVMFEKEQFDEMSKLPLETEKGHRK
ncbi:MAG: hypothetical protein ABI548_26410 [Polyangiaceae bacterium]